MNNETTIDLVKFEEAQRTISSIQKQFCEMVLNEIEKTSVFECDSLDYGHILHFEEHYCSSIIVADIPISLLFAVCPLKENPNLLSDFGWMSLILNCSKLDISNHLIEPRKNITVKLHFTGSSEEMLLQYQKTGES